MSTNTTVTIEAEPEDVRFDGETFAVTFNPRDYRLISTIDAGLAADDAAEATERHTRQAIWTDARISLETLLSLARADRLEDAVGITDLRTHGPAVAALYEAIKIVGDVVNAEDVHA